MQMAQGKIAGGRRQKGTMSARLATQEGLHDAKQCHPKQYAATAGNGLGWHLLPSPPQLARGGRSQLCGRTVVVNGSFSVERKKEHQGAKDNRQRPPQGMIWVGSKIHN